MARGRASALELTYLWGGTVTYPAGARLAGRVMEDFEFVWIQAGTARWHVNGSTLAAPEGAVLLSRPGFGDAYTWDPEHVTRHAYFHFAVRRMPGYLPERAAFALLRQAAGQDILRPLFSYVVGQLVPGVRVKPGPALTSAVETLLAAFVLGPTGVVPAAGRAVPEAVQRAAAFAGKRLAAVPAATVGLADLAEAAAVSPKHLCRLFAQHVGQSPMQMVLALRLQQAVGLLARSDLKLERIAEHCGFATVHHFSRRFHDVYGMPPGQARTALLKGQWHPAGQVRLGELAVEY